MSCIVLILLDIQGFLLSLLKLMTFKIGNK